MKCSSNIRFRMVESDTAGMQTCPWDSTCTEGNPSSAWRHKAKYPQGVSQKKLAQPGRSAQFTWQRNQCWQWADDFQWEENYGRLISTADGPFTLLLNFSVVYSWSFNCFSWCFDFLAVKQLRMVFWRSLHAHNNHTMAQGARLNWNPDVSTWMSGAKLLYLSKDSKKVTRTPVF